MWKNVEDKAVQRGGFFDCICIFTKKYVKMRIEVLSKREYDEKKKIRGG